MGKWCVHASLFIFYQIIIKVAGIQDRHKSLWIVFKTQIMVAQYVHVDPFGRGFDTRQRLAISYRLIVRRLALPVWHCRGTLYGSLEQNYRFVPPSAVVQAWHLVIPKPALPAFVFRTWKTKFKFFDTFDRGFCTVDKLFAPGKLLKVVHRGKQFSNVHLNQDCSKIGDQYGPPV